MGENGITTANDYRRASEAYHGLQRVTLPSGGVFLLRRPSLAYRLTHLASYQSVATRGQQGGIWNPDSPAEQQKLVEFYYAVLCEVCVSPRVSLDAPRNVAQGSLSNPAVVQELEKTQGCKSNPALHPEEIQARDAFWIARWAGGEVDAAGTDLAEFRKREYGADSVPGSGSADVELPPVGAAGPNGENSGSQTGNSKMETENWRERFVAKFDAGGTT